jgi:hypothetical protein
MAQYWQPTAASYTGRVSKGLILEAVAESPGEGAAGKISALKKDAMADVPGICAPAGLALLCSRRALFFFGPTGKAGRGGCLSPAARFHRLTFASIH